MRLLQAKLATVASSSFSGKMRKPLSAVTVATWTLDMLNFSSMTCFKTLSANVCASARVNDFWDWVMVCEVRGFKSFFFFTLWYCSCSSVWAPSEPAPIAFASYWVNVPEGSAWYLKREIRRECGRGEEILKVLMIGNLPPILHVIIKMGATFLIFTVLQTDRKKNATFVPIFTLDITSNLTIEVPFHQLQQSAMQYQTASTKKKIVKIN